MQIISYMGEVLIKVWLKSIKKYVSELLHKQMNAQKESLKKNFRFTNSRKPTKKSAMKMKVEIEEKKRRAPKIFFDGRKSL